MTDTPESDFPASPTPELTTSATMRFPWPPPEDAPILPSLVDTWRGAVRHPASFFRAMPEHAALGPALLYYLVIGILAAAIQLFWGSVLPAPEAPLLQSIFGATDNISPLLEFLLSPLYLLFSLFLAAGVTHLMVLILVPGSRGIGGTVRVMCFAYSPVIFGVVPYVGTVVAFVWMTVLSIVGIREVHRTSTARAATAVLVPVLLAVLAVIIASVLLVTAGELLLER